MTEAKITIRCDIEMYNQFRTLSFLSNKKYSELLKELMENYKNTEKGDCDEHINVNRNTNT